MPFLIGTSGAATVGIPLEAFLRAYGFFVLGADSLSGFPAGFSFFCLRTVAEESASSTSDSSTLERWLFTSSPASCSFSASSLELVPRSLAISYNRLLATSPHLPIFPLGFRFASSRPSRSEFRSISTGRRNVRLKPLLRKARSRHPPSAQRYAPRPCLLYISEPTRLRRISYAV